MLLTLIIILLLIGSAVVWSIYSNFTVFYRSFGETENYNKAYYASISALERAELAIKQHSPWYEWSGGRIQSGNHVQIQNSSLATVDGPMNDFSYIWSGKQTDMSRKIESRTSRIPQEWKWDIEPELAGTGSTNYNKMDYENAEVFLLYYDISNNSPYASGTIEKSSFSSSSAIISWQIKLPPKLKNERNNWELDDKNKLIEWYNSPQDDAIVDRQIRGKYEESSTDYPFTIFATQNSNSSKDSSIRESDLNNTVPLDFLTNDWDPLWTTNTPTIISAIDEKILSQWTLSNLFSIGCWSNPLFKDCSIRLSLLNLLKTKGGLIYPYLEYYMDFWSATVSDKYYTITTRWKVADFQVDITIQKPTVKESILWNFTVIF